MEKSLNLSVESQLIFINYGSEDREFAFWLHDQLTASGYQVWLDRSSIKGGEQWKKEIDKGIHNCFVMLSILSPTSVDPSREWILYEQRLAQKLFRPIIPLLLKPCDLPQHLQDLNYLDFTTHWERNLGLLVASIQEKSLRSGEFLADETPTEGRDFVGRGLEMVELYALVNSDQTPEAVRTPVAIQGMAGSGKTMMIREFVRRVGKLYPGGVIYEQRGENKEPVQSVFKRWVQYVIGSYPDKDFSASEVRAMLQRYGVMLFAFDDIWADDFENIRQLMEALPKDVTRILTTQFRREAQLIGCKVYELDRLNDTDAEALLISRLSEKPGPEPDLNELQRLIQVVQGHPLALELAAGQCDHTEDLSELIDDLIEDLEYGVDAFDSPIININASSSVKVSLDKSYRALQEADKQFSTEWASCFVALGIFPDNIILENEIIGAVWGYSARRQIKETLSALSNRALIIRLAQKSYILHPVIRAYARELLLASDIEERTKARNYYVQYVNVYAKARFSQSPETWSEIDKITPHIQQVGGILSKDVDEFLGDIEFLSQPHSEAESMLQAIQLDENIRVTLQLTSDFVDAIYPYLRNHSEIGGLGKKWLQAGIVATKCLKQSNRSPLFMKELAWWFHLHGRSREAISYYEAALQLTEQSSDELLKASILGEMGYIRANVGEVDVKLAIQLHQEALEIYRKHQDSRGEARILYYLGRDYWTQALHDKAFSYYEQSVAIHQDARNLNAIGSAYFVRGDSGDYEQALEYFSRSLDLSRKQKNLLLEAENLNDAGAANIYLQDYEAALQPLKNAILLFQKTGNRRVESIAHGNLGAALRGLGRFTEALDSVTEALSIAREIETPKEEAWALHQLALIYHQQGRYSEALEALEDALNRMAKIENARTLAGLRANYGWLLFDGFQQTDKALENIDLAINLLKENDLRRGHSNITLDEIHERKEQILQAMQ